jgi:hypothetical protein
MQSTTIHRHACSLFALFGSVWFCLVGPMILAQSSETTQPPTPSKLSLKAEIVLSRDFCATKKRQSLALKDVLNVGKATCTKLYEALIPVFSDLKRIEKAPVDGTSAAQVTLIPRFTDIIATQQPFRPSSQRKLVIFLEWMIQDSTGHTIWLQTVQGSSEHKAGWAITTKGVTAMVDDAVSVLAKNSVAKISTAFELQKLSK